MDETYTINEVAKILKYNPETIRRLIREGKINAFRIGMNSKFPYRISAKEIEKLLR